MCVWDKPGGWVPGYVTVWEVPAATSRDLALRGVIYMCKSEKGVCSLCQTEWCKEL